MVNLHKYIIDLEKKAAVAVANHGLKGQTAQVVLVLDISKSMNRLFKDGTMQRLMERIVGLALNFDDDGDIDVMLFGTRGYQLPSVSLSNLEGYIEHEVLANYRVIEATKYAQALHLIQNKYQGNTGDPVFVIFLTDGNNSDKTETTSLITQLSTESIFFQFVGIGKETFPYLKKLDDLPNRLIDNAGFMHINDIDTIVESELYDRLLNEFPEWLEEAKKKRIL